MFFTENLQLLRNFKGEKVSLLVLKVNETMLRNIVKNPALSGVLIM